MNEGARNVRRAIVQSVIDNCGDEAAECGLLPDDYAEAVVSRAFPNFEADIASLRRLSMVNRIEAINASQWIAQRLKRARTAMTGPAREKRAVSEPGDAP